MKVQTKATGGFSLSITKGRGHSTRVPPLAADMLHEVLRRAGVTEGKYGFQVIGFHSGISAENSKYFLSLSAPRERSVRVNMKCGKSSLNSIKGVFQCSRDADMALLYPKLTQVVSALNDEGWSSLWAREQAVEKITNAPVVADVEPPRLVLVSNSEVPAETLIPESRVAQEKLTEPQKKLKHLFEERQRLNEQILALIKWRTRDEIIAMLLE